MTALLPVRPLPYNPAKHMRRTATAVMAGAFDIRPTRDVLTNLLNGVGPYQSGEKEEEQRHSKRKEKHDAEHSRKRRKTSHKPHDQAPASASAFMTPADAPSASTSEVAPPPPKRSVSSFWSARRPVINLTGTRSPSMTPPPLPPIHMPSTPASTPGPSISSSTSRTSSKRLRTPDDDEELDELADDRSELELIPPPEPRKSRKKRFAAKKGWKGWVEGSPQPSEKLINLDAQVVLVDRRTRSGKSFDAY